MNWCKTIKGSALHFSVLVATIVALLLSSFLLLSKTQHFFKVRSNNFVDDIQATSKGLKAYLKSESSNAVSGAFEYRSSALTIEHSFWGGFEKYTSTAAQINFSKLALVGTLFDSPIPSLILQDNFLPLVVSGNAYVEGVAILPESGVKAGAIAGEYYRRENLIYGPVRDVNSSGFPKLSEEWRSYVIGMTDYIPSQEDFNLSDIRSAKNSFSKSTQFYYSQDEIYFDGQIIGNVIVKSEDRIVISRNAQVNDAFFIAPYIEIEDNFIGRLHAVATDSIVVGNRVKLEYPSSLALSDNSEETIGSIFLKENTTVQGNVIYMSVNDSEETNTNVIISESSTIQGALYCEGALVIKGEIQGTAITYFTLTSKAGQRYKNHIYNGRIVTSQVPEQTAGLPLANQSKQIALWLY